MDGGSCAESLAAARKKAQFRSSRTRSSAPTPNKISCLVRNVTASAVRRARANSSPRHRNASSAGESTTTSLAGRIPLIRAIESANRSCAAASLVAWTRRVATLPRSVESISTTASCRSSNSKRLHLAAARFRFAMRSRTNPEQPDGTNSKRPSTSIRAAAASRQTSSQRMPKVNAASMDPCDSEAFTPSRAKAVCPCLSRPRA